MEYQNGRAWNHWIDGTAAVVSSATLFFSGIMDSSGQAQTEESFLLNDRGPYSTCLPASGPWPDNSQDDDHNHGEDDNIHDDDDNPTSDSYVTCFSFEGGQDQCWSHSYKDGWGNWQPCKPKGYGTGWEFGTPTNDRMDKTHTCGTACTEFSKDVPTSRNKNMHSVLSETTVQLIVH